MDLHLRECCHAPRLQDVLHANNNVPAGNNVQSHHRNTCLNHFEHLQMSDTKTVQQVLATKLDYVHNGFALNVDTDYFITFPCMHIALPFIAWWFCREWKRIARVVFIYNIALVPSILLLEWHYVADIFGGLVVAVLCLFISETGTRPGRLMTSSSPGNIAPTQ